MGNDVLEQLLKEVSLEKAARLMDLTREGVDLDRRPRARRRQGRFQLPLHRMQRHPGSEPSRSRHCNQRRRRCRSSHRGDDCRS